MKKTVLYIIVMALTLTSCNTSKKILYLQDAKYNQPTEIATAASITVQPNDQISIVVSSRDPQLAALFNLPRVSYYSGNSNLNNINNQLSGYTIDEKGEIDFPVLGKLHVAGMTKTQIAERVKTDLMKDNLCKDPVVTVEFMNLNVSIIGEVAKPGKYFIDKDRLTLTEALSMAGDLTIYGRRDSVMVIREDNGQRTIYPIDLRSQAFFDSPAYYLKQNDVVYVKPNKVRAGQSTLNENSVKSVSLWISVLSVLSTLFLWLKYYN